MSSRSGLASRRATLPANPRWIQFPRSDGDSSSRPGNTEYIVGADGQVNWMEACSIDDPRALKWRVGVAAGVAKQLNMPEADYVLSSFPEGYELFDHAKGPASAPRHDMYLFGCPTAARYRSVNEFVPHAVWLITDETLDRNHCGCKYCSKNPQSLISDHLGLSKRGIRGSSSTKSPKRTLRQRLPRNPQDPYAAVRVAPKPVKLTGPSQAMVAERNTDILASNPRNAFEASRWHRKGELVWCAIDPPIRGRTREEDVLLWPGIVEDVNIQSTAIPRSSADNVHMVPADISGPTSNANGMSDGQSGSGSSIAVDTPWDVQHRNLYTIKLLALARGMHATDEYVLPYLAYVPSKELIQAMSTELPHVLDSTPDDEMEHSLTALYDFNPFAAEGAVDEFDPARYREATAPLTLAMQIASSISHYWLPTDEWECTLTAPIVRTPPAPGESISAGPSAQTSPRPGTPEAGSAPSQPPIQTLHSVINQSMAHNAANTPRGPATPHASASASAGPATRASTMTQTITQMRYQGLWWGAERIWVDELVRIKLARAQFAPHGTASILPPAGPSASTMAELEAIGAKVDDASVLGASEKGLFLRLQGLWAIEMQHPDGSWSRECRICGELYELADADWEEPAPAPAPAPVEDAKGKGKARALDAGGALLSGADRTEGAASQIGQPTEAGEGGVAAGAQASNPNRRGSGEQLSHPVLTAQYALPAPPRGMKFRSILKPGHEVVLSLSLLSGRYYPQLLGHPRLLDRVNDALQMGLHGNQALWAMEGLSAGMHQSMDPVYWRPTRLAVFQDADAEARASLRAVWEDHKAAKLGLPPREYAKEEGHDEDVPMNVD